MPTKNRRRFAAEALRRFVAQDYAGALELVIVEDGEESVQDLVSPAAQMGGPHRALRFFQHLRHEGNIGAKLNFAAGQARGEILARWDDDDFYAPDRIRRQLAFLQLTGKAMVGCNSFLAYREGEPHGWEYTGDGWFAAGATQMYRRNWALAHRYPETNDAEDFRYAQIAHEQGELSVLTRLDVLVAREHDANTSPREDDKYLPGVTINGQAYPSLNWRKVSLDRIQAVIGR